MPKFICNKLSRDKTIENMNKTGIKSDHRILEPQEFKDALNQKLMEEALEVTEATNRQELIAELADVLEVIDGFCTAHNISHDEIQAIKLATRQVRGGFQDGIYVETIEMAEDNPVIGRFRKSPEKYKEF